MRSSSCPAFADERQALLVLVGAGPFADEAELRRGIPAREHRLRARRVRERTSGSLDLFGQASPGEPWTALARTRHRPSAMPRRAALGGDGAADAKLAAAPRDERLVRRRRAIVDGSREDSGRGLVRRGLRARDAALSSAASARRRGRRAGARWLRSRLATPRARGALAPDARARRAAPSFNAPPRAPR